LSLDRDECALLAVGVTLTRAVQCGVVQAGDLFGEIAAITGSRECRKFAKPVVRRRRLKFISLQRACNCGDFGCSVTTVCRLSPAELQYFQFPVGRLAADERAECRVISISVLIEHRCRAAAAAAAGRVLSTITPLSSSSPVLHGRRRHRHAVPCRLRLCCQ